MSKQPKKSFSIDNNTMKRLAGARSYERGADYFTSGLVGSVVEHASTLTANVKGTRTYRVKLWVNSGELDYSCSCPMGDDGNFCKHCVAVGLTWLAAKHDKSSTTKSKPSRSRVVSLDDIRRHLQTADKNTLIDLLLEQAQQSDSLRRRLTLQTANKSNKKNSLDAYRRAIDEATAVNHFVDYDDAYNYAHQIREVIQSIEKLLGTEHANEVIELTEYALASVERSMGSVDDSDGKMGSILDELQELHYRACVKGKPNARALAQRLFAWEIGTDWGTFHGAAETYTKVLGKEGLAEYRVLAEATWRKIPERTPGSRDSDSYGKRFRITHIMEILAKQSGDVEAVIAIKARDLSSAYHFLNIAETYLQAGKHDEALAWAERGLKAFPKHPDSRLREFLAKQYHRRKRHEEAMALAWLEFNEHPNFEQYKTLKQHADRCKQWPVWREKALELLRASITISSQSQSMRYTNYSSELVQIHLWEKDLDAAWAQAQTNGCSDMLWMQLAKLRETSHPEDALGIYRKRIAPIINLTHNDAYAEAVKLLRMISAIMTRLNQKTAFSQYLAAIRAQYKAKRNLIKLLDETRFD